MIDNETPGLYALRRTLPPWSFDDNLAELIEYLPRYGVDEIIVKVDAETFSHGHPTLEWVRAYQPKLARIREAMDRLGIIFSINPWFTLGHCDRGWDGSSVPEIDRIVGHDGAACRECACPLSSAWREHLLAVWRLYAETGPRVLWVEDDIRNFNHSPATFGCFCPAHLKMFSRRIGKKVGRKKVVQAILKSGKPHPWRREYLAMQGEIMVDVARQLSTAVQEVDPGIHLGLMSSGHHYHSIEGRKWTEFGEALAGDRALYSRPPLGMYTETSLHDLYYNQDSIKGTRRVLPRGVLEQAEVDNGFFSLYTCSVAMTFLKIATSIGYGCDGVTMNLFDHNGTPMEQEPALGRFLSENKAFFSGLAGVCRRPGRYRGVQLLHHPDASSFKVLSEDSDYSSLDPAQHAGMEHLEALGIPTTYDDEDVVSVSGQLLRALAKKQIRKLLSGGLLLDGSAARVLVERGFGNEIGLKAVGETRQVFDVGPYNAEEFFHPDFGGSDHLYLVTLFGPVAGAAFCPLKPEKDATVISRLVDPDARRGPPSMVAYENKLGGRVVAHGFDLEHGYGANYCRPERVQQFHGVIRWLSREKAPVLVRGEGAWPLGFRKDLESESIVGFFNLSLDAWPSVTLDLETERRLASVRRLERDGSWTDHADIGIALNGGRLTLRHAQPISHGEPLFLLLGWE